MSSSDEDSDTLRVDTTQEDSSSDSASELSELCGWFEGFFPAVCNNNSLERRNLAIKTRETLREKVALREFLLSPAVLPKISPTLFKEAEKLKADNRNISQVDDGEFYLMANTDKDMEFAALSTLFAAHEELAFADWKSYKKVNNRLACITPSKTWPSEFYVCTCPTGAKKNPCKHSVLVMLHLKKTMTNPYADTVERKRKSGRPRLAKNALQAD